MIRFVCNRACPEFETSIRQFADLFEKLISEGDRNVHDLAHDGFEALWEHDEREFISGYFGPKTRDLGIVFVSGSADNKSRLTFILRLTLSW